MKASLYAPVTVTRTFSYIDEHMARIIVSRGAKIEPVLGSFRVSVDTIERDRDRDIEVKDYPKGRITKILGISGWEFDGMLLDPETYTD